MGKGVKDGLGPASGGKNKLSCRNHLLLENIPTQEDQQKISKANAYRVAQKITFTEASMYSLTIDKHPENISLFTFLKIYSHAKKIKSKIMERLKCLYIPGLFLILFS